MGLTRGSRAILPLSRRCLKSEGSEGNVSFLKAFFIIRKNTTLI